MLVVLNGVKGRQTIDKQIHKELSMAENEGAAVAVDNVAVPTNEWERMLSGELYICGDMQREANMRKRRLVHAINTSAYDAFEERDRLFRELFGSLGKGAFLEPPFNCDYGCNTYIGDNFYANMDCIFLDVARITIGDRVFFGPRVGLYCVLGLFAKTLVVDKAIESIHLRKVCTVICSEPLKVEEFIVKHLNRTATISRGYGAFSGKCVTVIMSVLSRREAVQLRRYAREVDPGAFITIVDSSEIVGKGFRGTN